MDLGEEAAFHIYHADVVDFLLGQVRLLATTPDTPEANKELQANFELLLERVPLDSIVGVFVGILASTIDLLAIEQGVSTKRLLNRLKILWRD